MSPDIIKESNNGRNKTIWGLLAWTTQRPSQPRLTLLTTEDHQWVRRSSPSGVEERSSTLFGTPSLYSRIELVFAKAELPSVLRGFLPVLSSFHNIILTFGNQPNNI